MLIIPTQKELLEQIRGGKQCEGILPLDPKNELSQRSQIEFQEATFDGYGVPTPVEKGERVSAEVVSTEFRGDTWLGYKLFATKWVIAKCLEDSKSTTSNDETRDFSPVQRSELSQIIINVPGAGTRFPDLGL